MIVTLDVSINSLQNKEQFKFKLKIWGHVHSDGYFGITSLFSHCNLFDCKTHVNEYDHASLFSHAKHVRNTCTVHV